MSSAAGRRSATTCRCRRIHQPSPTRPGSLSASCRTFGRSGAGSAPHGPQSAPSAGPCRAALARPNPFFVPALPTGPRWPHSPRSGLPPPGTTIPQSPPLPRVPANRPTAPSTSPSPPCQGATESSPRRFADHTRFSQAGNRSS